MSPSELFLAVVMLSAPVGTPERTPPPEHWPLVRSALLAVATDWEILDPRESRYVLARPEEFQTDLDFLRKRRVELADAPRLADSLRLPDRRLLDDYIQFNRAFRRHLENRMLWEPDRAVALIEVLRENERLYRLWDATRDARCEFHYVTYRRLALKKLRDGLGEAAYLAGELPPYVPHWHFSPVPFSPVP
jgi:hypothetical protein